MMVNQMNQQQLLQWLDMVSFAVVDVTEYLDTHPQDEEALKYFDHYQELRKTALKAYAEKYGPLTVDMVDAGCSTFSWADMPLPWEGGNC